MARSHKISSAVGIGMAAVLLAGCGTARAHQTVPAAADPAPTATPKVITANVRACSGVQGVIGHLTVATVHWSPTLHPFDKGIAAQIKLLAGDLDKQAGQADSKRIDGAVHLSARAFANVSSAMTSRDRANLNKAIRDSRIAYKVLKQACTLS
jgi:hypothetical protein